MLSIRLAFVKDWLGHANIQNTTIYARLTTATLDSTARKVFAVVFQKWRW